MSRYFLSLLVAGLLAASTSAQSASLDARWEARRAERLAVTGVPAPELPPVLADSPADSLVYADRRPVGQGPTPAQPEGTPVMVEVTIPAVTTGTGFEEFMEYQLPVTYSAVGTPHPLLVGYHGYGAPDQSVAEQSTIDEECNARDWIYLAPTGLDDQIFGTPASQQNTEAAIQYMIDNFNVDVDRIYMVGFSMGGGIVANFAARRRDPDGIMIAAVGLVSSTLDWTMEYALGSFAIKAWLAERFNFNGTPNTHAFNYHQASVLKHLEHSYPPLPGTYQPEFSMGRNLEGIPTYITYDSGDVLVQVPPVNDSLETVLNGLGTTVQKRVQVGTVDPSDGVTPAPHSWAVLDETELFTFLDGKVVDRHPETFDALLDRDTSVSWLDVTQAVPNALVYVNGAVDTGLDEVAVTEVINAGDIVLHADEAGLGASDGVRVTATSSALDVRGFGLTITGFTDRPSYLLDAVGATLITGVDSDPTTDSLIYDVGPMATVDAEIVQDPEWTSTFTTTPNPVLIGTPLFFELDGPPTSTSAYWIFGVAEVLTPVKGVVLTTSPAPPAVLIALPLFSGDVSFQLGIPNDPLLSGVRVPWQVVTLVGPVVESVSNHWGVYID